MITFHSEFDRMKETKATTSNLLFVARNLLGQSIFQANLSLFSVSRVQICCAKHTHTHILAYGQLQEL